MAMTAIFSGLVATLLDFTLDPMGLATGWWIWHRTGGYATSLRGANGVAGIPASNFFGWFVLTVIVVLCFESSTRKSARERHIFARERFETRSAATLYFALCLPGLVWALRSAHWDLFFFSAVPLCALAAAVWRRRRRGKNTPVHGVR